MTQGTPCSSQLIFCDQQLAQAREDIEELKLQLAAVQPPAADKRLPQGYTKTPADYTGAVYLESQMKAYGLSIAERILAMWEEPWISAKQPFINRLHQFVAELRSM